MRAFLATVKTTPGRFWAYVGTIFGITVSALANHAESLHYAPEWMAVGMGTVPVFLFISLEVLVRNKMKEHLAWWRGGLITVAVASGITSYAHMALLVYRHTAGSPEVQFQSLTWVILLALALIVPVVPDGTMLLSTLALLYDPDKREAATSPAPASRFEYIVQIPAAPVITRTITLEPRSAEVPRAPEPPKRPRKAPTGRRSTGVRFNRPTEHPLFAQWQREGWDDETFAARSGKSLGAARAQAGRWRKYLEANPGIGQNQMELIGS